MMMASDNKKTTTESAQKSEASAKSPKSAASKETSAKEVSAKEAPAKEAPAKKESTSGAEPSKAEGGEAAAESPSSYSRGEGQKPVTKAYKENWNAIFGKNKKKKR
jgi:hypothetical protein